MRRFPRLPFGTIGLLFLCLGFAILGTGIVDYVLRQQDARRRTSWAPQPAHMQPSSHWGSMAINPPVMQTLAVSAGSPLFSGLYVMGMKVPPWLTKTFSVGSAAPDFTLPNALDRHPVHLAEYRGKRPVVLLFGSFGCDVFCNQLARVNKLYQAYKDRAEFLFVYITEAPHTVLPPPTEADKKLGHIPRGLRYFNISFPCLLGNKDVEEAYSPFPTRLLIVDWAGRIALDAGFGQGFPRNWDFNEIESCLRESARTAADSKGIPADSRPDVPPK